MNMVEVNSLFIRPPSPAFENVFASAVVDVIVVGSELCACYRVCVCVCVCLFTSCARISQRGN